MYGSVSHQLARCITHKLGPHRLLPVLSVTLRYPQTTVTSPQLLPEPAYREVRRRGMLPSHWLMEESRQQSLLMALCLLQSLHQAQ
jgi:hypothetical protein